MTTPEPAASVEPASPAYDPAAVLAGVYRLDVAAGLDEIDAAWSKADRAQEVVRLRDELSEGGAWLVLDPDGEALLLYGPDAESMEVDGLSLVPDASGFAMTLEEHPDRAAARCQAASEVRLECDFEFEGSELQVPLPVVFEREATAHPGLPEPGLYGWKPAQGVEQFADAESIQNSLVSSGVDPSKARDLAQDLLSRPSLNIVAGDSLWTLNNGITWLEDPSEAAIKRGVFPLARLEATTDGFRIERRMPQEPDGIIEDCRLMDAGFACRSAGRESIYERRITSAAK